MIKENKQEIKDKNKDEREKLNISTKDNNDKEQGATEQLGKEMVHSEIASSNDTIPGMHQAKGNAAPKDTKNESIDGKLSQNGLAEYNQIMELVNKLQASALEASKRIESTSNMPDGGLGVTTIKNVQSLFSDGAYTSSVATNRSNVEVLNISQDNQIFSEGQISLIRNFEFRDEIIPYIVYDVQNTNLQMDAYHPVTVSDDAIVGATVLKFKVGLGLASLQYNELKTNSFGLMINNGVPATDTMFNETGAILLSSDVLRFRMGQLRLLYGMYQDNGVYTVRNTTMVPPRDITPELRSMIGTKIQHDIGVNPALISISTMYPRWLTDDIKLNLSGDIYKLGKIRDTYERRFGVKSMSIYGVNADHFTCAILNANAHYLSNNRVSVEYQTNQLLNCALRGSKIETLPSSDLRLDSPRIQAIDERAIALALILDNKLPERMFDINIDVLHSFDVIQASDKMVLYDQDKLSTGVAQVNLYQTLTRWAGAVDVGKVIKLFAMEVTPHVHIMRLAPMLDIDVGSDDGLILLWLIKLNVDFRPNAFNGIKHLVQQYLFGFMSHWMSSEYLIFCGRYGSYYVIENGKKKFVNVEYDFKPEDLLSGRFPSLFAGIDFEGCPNITKLMNCLKPMGVEEEDRQPDIGAFPRLNRSPTHYKPYNPGTNGSIINQTASYQVFISLLLRISTSLEIRRPGSIIEQIRTWFSWTVSRMQLIFEGMNQISDAMSVLQNLPHNVLRNFNGRFDIYKPMNMRAVGTSSSRDMIRDRGDSNSLLARYSLTDVLAIFGQMETPSMQAQGKTRIKTEIRFETHPPDPLSLLAPSMNIVDECTQFAHAYAFVSLCLSDEGLHSFPELSIIRDRLPSITEGMFKSILRDIAETSGIDTKAMSQVEIALNEVYASQKMDLGKIQIRRVVNGIVKEFDSTIDRASLKDSNWFMDDIHLARLKIGLASLHNKRLPRIRQGLRFCQQHQLQFNIDYIPSVAGKTVIEYSRENEVTSYVGNENRTGFIFNGITYFKASSFPRDLHIKIKTGRDVSTIHRSLLDLGVCLAGWIVDVEEAWWIPRLTIDLNERSNTNLMSVLQGNDETVHLVILYDTITWNQLNRALLPRDQHIIHSIFPITPVSDSISMRGIVVSEERENWHISPRRAEMDTGHLTDSGVMQYSDTGINKLLITNEVSMTNSVLTYPNEVTLDGKFPYRYIEPQVWPYKQ